jgi:hypothetical protein
MIAIIVVWIVAAGILGWIGYIAWRRAGLHSP